MKPRILVLTVALLCLLAAPTVALANDEPGGKIDPSVVTVLEATGGDVAIPVMVNAPGALNQVSATIPLGVDVTELPLVGSVAAFLTPEEIQALGDASFVTDIVADNPVHGFDYRSTMDVTNLTIGLGDVRAPATGGPAGDGVTVAVLDSGVATNTDLADSRIVGWKDFVNGQPTPYDDAGHGTYVAGLIAGDGTASLPRENGGATVQFRGVAPAADIVGIKVLDEIGQGRTSTLIAGIAWVIAHKNDYNIRVLNISIGGNPVASFTRDPVDQAVEAAWRRGITVVCAAGNEGDFGPGGILSPGNDPFVITAGATDTQETADVSDDVVASYSSVGPTLFDEVAKPDLVAPGYRLISLRTQGSYIDTNFPENVIPVADYLAPTTSAEPVSNYLMLSGTSTSAPVVAGAAALMIGADPSLTPNDVKVRLMGAADHVAGASANQQGAGTLDVDGALASTTRANGPALSAFLGEGRKLFTNGDYNKWQKRAWEKYGWTKYAWTKYAWTKYAWTKYAWTKYAWTKYAWTKYAWTKYAWTTLIEGQ